jgi:hypothetical protein
MSKDDHLHIFVNRKKFGSEDGVTATMTGAQIAFLVDVAADNAIIREGKENGAEIAADKPISIKMGDHFFVTRKIVDGGEGV